MSFSLKKHEILRSKKQIKELFQNGSSFFIYPFKVYHIHDGSAEGPMVLFSVPKKNLKRAVDRNLVRRRMREVYRLNKSLLNTGDDSPFSLSLTFIYVSEKVLSYSDIDFKLKQVLIRLSKTLVKQ